MEKAGVPGGAVESHSSHCIDDARIGEAPGDQLHVIRRCHARNGGDMRNDFCLLDLVEKRGDERMFHAPRDRLGSQKLSWVRDDLMARVKDSDFHRFISVNVVRKGRTGLVPWRATGAERVLDHPLAEILMRDGRVVRDAQFTDKSQLGGARRWRDGIDHGVRKGCVRIDPVGQRGVGQAGERDDGLAKDVTVALEVVAGLACERTLVCRATQTQRLDHRAEGGEGRAGVFRIVPDIGVVGVEALGGGIDVVSAFGHGQGDDADIGLGHAADEGTVSFLDGQEIDHGTDHLGRDAFGREFD